MKIEIWETEWHRESGESFVYDETYEDFETALKSARKIYEENSYASIMILGSENEPLYCRDDESEEFYFDNEKISFVSEEIISEYIDNWFNHKEQTFKERQLYCKDENKFIAIDNTSDNCWVEEFSSEKEAQNWLLGKDLEMEEYEK